MRSSSATHEQFLIGGSLNRTGVQFIQHPGGIQNGSGRPPGGARQMLERLIDQPGAGLDHLLAPGLAGRIEAFEHLGLDCAAGRVVKVAVMVQPVVVAGCPHHSRRFVGAVLGIGKGQAAAGRQAAFDTAVCGPSVRVGSTASIR